MSEYKHKDDDNEEKKVTRKKPRVWAFTRCWIPKCEHSRVLIDDSCDPDDQLARHLHNAHQIPYPDWVRLSHEKSYQSRGKKRYQKS